MRELHDNLFRYYDPDYGRFTHQDPIGLAGGKSLPVCAECAGGDPIGLTACKNGSPKRSVRNMSFADWIKRKAKGGNNIHVYLRFRITEEPLNRGHARSIE